MAEKVLHTYEDYLELPDDGKLHQIVGGELHVSPAPVPRHQLVVLNIALALRQATAERDDVVILHETDLVLSDRDVVRPDLQVLVGERVARVGERYVEGAPSIVVEVLSPSTRDLDRGAKLELYRRRGVEEAWLVDLEADEVERVELGEEGDRETLAGEDLLGTPLLAGFSVAVGEVLETPV